MGDSQWHHSNVLSFFAIFVSELGPQPKSIQKIVVSDDH
jgi:hypothetical protein